MGWIIVLFGAGLLVIVTHKTLDRETARNLRFLSKLLAAVVVFIALLMFLSYAGN